MRRLSARVGLGAFIVVALATALILTTAMRSPASTRRATTYRFVVWGDVRPASTNWPTAQSAGFKHVVARLATQSYAADIMVGDYVNLKPSDGTARVNAKYAGFRTTAARVLRKTTYFTLGNHEVADGYGNTRLLESLFRRDLHVAGTVNYSWRHLDGGRLNLIILDSEMPGYMQHIGYYGETARNNSTQAKWLVRTLRAIRTRSKAAWIIISDHRPIATPESKDALGRSSTERNALKALFVKYGVDLSVAGDTHYYRRHVEPTGPTYLVQGTGGAPSDSIGTVPLTRYDVGKADFVFGYTMFTFANNRLTGVTYEASSSNWRFRIVDRFTVPNRRAR